VTLQHAYVLMGILLAWTAWRAARSSPAPARSASVWFWSFMSVAFLFGDRLPAPALGAGVVGMGVVAGLGGMRPTIAASDDEAARRASAAALGDRLFGPALLIPLLTVAALFALRPVRIGGTPLLEPKNASLLSLVVACASAWVVALAVTKDRARASIDDGARLLDTIGWAAVLPLMLATLGGVFAAAGVGDALSAVIRATLPTDHRAVVACAYAIGMSLFSALLGNAFAAFPVMTAAIGFPLLVQQYHGNPAAVGALGMLSGYTGTLLTPMAANFNLVPAALLELRDPYGVIKAQVPTSLALLATNLVLINVLPFR